MPRLPCLATPCLDTRACRASPHLSWPGLTIPATPYLAMPRHTVPCRACHALPGLAWPCLTSPSLPHHARPYLAMPCLPHHTVPGRTLPRLPYLAPPCFTKPCLTCHALPHHAWIHAPEQSARLTDISTIRASGYTMTQVFRIAPTPAPMNARDDPRKFQRPNLPDRRARAIALR